VEYDPARLAQVGKSPTSNTDILCHVRFLPMGDTYSESVLEHAVPRVGTSGSPRPALLEVLVPMEKVAEVRGGKKTVSTRKLHPSRMM